MVSPKSARSPNDGTFSVSVSAAEVRRERSRSTPSAISSPGWERSPRSSLRNGLSSSVAEAPTRVRGPNARVAPSSSREYHATGRSVEERHRPGTTTPASVSNVHRGPSRRAYPSAPASQEPDPLKSAELPVGALIAASIPYDQSVRRAGRQESIAVVSPKPGSGERSSNVISPPGRCTITANWDAGNSFRPDWSRPNARWNASTALPP